MKTIVVYKRSVNVEYDASMQLFAFHLLDNDGLSSIIA